MKKLVVSIAAMLALSGPAFSQSGVIQGQNSPGIYAPLTANGGTPSNPLDVNLVAVTGSGVVSATNSSVTPLGISGVFTGTAISFLPYGSATIAVIADQASATVGLSIQQSPNGTNWDISDDYLVAASTSTKINVPRQGAFFRIVYTNGAVAQTSFRLQTIMNTDMPRAVSVKPVAPSMTMENDFDQTLSVQYIYNGNNLDIARQIIPTNNTSGGGITAAGVLAQFDDVSTTPVTENNFGNLRMASDHSLLTSIQNSFAHIATSTTTTVKSGAGTLKSIIVNTLGTVASTTTVYDNTAGSGTVIAVINTLALAGTFTYDAKFSTGLTLVTTGTVAPDITVSYK